MGMAGCELELVGMELGGNQPKAHGSVPAQSFRQASMDVRLRQVQSAISDGQRLGESVGVYPKFGHSGSRIQGQQPARP